MSTTSDPLQPLRDALALAGIDPVHAERLDAGVRAALRAALPGRQQKKNLDPEMVKARKAYVRALRRKSSEARLGHWERVGWRYRRMLDYRMAHPVERPAAPPDPRQTSLFESVA